MKFTPILLCFGLFTLLSCESIIENISNNIEVDNYKSPYAGTYTGTYSGQDAGTLKIVVSSKDLVTVNRYSSNFKTEEEFYGGMIGPSFNQVKSQKTDFKIDGTLTSQTKTYKGSWSQSGLSGEWTIIKQ